MPAAAVIPAPEDYGIIAETKTSVVGITDLPSRPIRVVASCGVRSRPLVVSAASVRVRGPNQVIKTSSCSMVLHGIVERTGARCPRAPVTINGSSRRQGNWRARGKI